MRADVNANEQVASRSAASARTPLARGAYAGAFVDAGGDLHLDPAWTIGWLEVDRERRPGERVLELDLGLALDVLAPARDPASSATGAEVARRLRSGAAEELLEEVTERRTAAEHALELVRRDRPIPEVFVVARKGVRRGLPARSHCSYSCHRGPSSSYFLRFSGSPSTSLASLISLNRSSADLSPWLTSG